MITRRGRSGISQIKTSTATRTPSVNITTTATKVFSMVLNMFGYTPHSPRNQGNKLQTTPTLLLRGNGYISVLLRHLDFPLLHIIFEIVDLLYMNRDRITRIRDDQHAVLRFWTTVRVYKRVRLFMYIMGESFQDYSWIQDFIAGFP